MANPIGPDCSMLVKLTDNKGEDFWVNPIHVKTVRRKGKWTEVAMVVGSMGNVAYKVSGTPEEIAELLNAGMPGGMVFPPEDDGDDGVATAVAILG